MYSKILIVDDSKISRMIVKKIIAEVSPAMVVVEAGSAKEALVKLKNEDVDAAILDFHMPEVTGIELAVKIKEIKPELPMSLLTANIQDEIKTQCDDLGIGYMAKPPKKEPLEKFLTS